MKISFALRLMLVASLSLGAGWYMQQQEREEMLQSLKATYFSPATKISSFELVDKNGQAFTNKSLYGKWSYVFLGYTHCPDICPTTLAQLNRFSKKATSEGLKDFQIVFISVDPLRDDTARLKEYTDYFNTDFIAATANHDVLFPLVADLGLKYGMVDKEQTSDYAVAHSASIALINPQGQLQAIFKPKVVDGQPPHVDMEQMLSESLLIIE